MNDLLNLYSDYNENNFPCLERKYKYAKLHFDNLDLNLKSRCYGEKPVDLLIGIIKK